LSKSGQKLEQAHELPGKPKVKLAAIAKDEAAYLAEWIHHHRYFGFDAIDIYVNNTSDNSWQYAERFRRAAHVNLIDADAFFDGETACPQTRVYRHALEQSRKDGFTHLLCLDVDEFWTPADLGSSIKDCIDDCGGEVISFEWFNRHEAEDFGRPVERSISGVRHQFVKSLFSTSADVRQIGIHNVIARGARYTLADGREFSFPGSHNEFVSREESRGDLKPYFILHRMYRSQKEYVSLLGRGRPAFQDPQAIRIKDNRLGYNALSQAAQTLEFDEDAVSRYHASYDDFVQAFGLSDSIRQGREFVLHRYGRVLDTIAKAGLEDFQLIEKVLGNVDLPECRLAFAQCLENCMGTLRDHFTISTRDGGMAAADGSSGNRQKLLRFLSKLRPRVLLFRKKW
jgi:hypothetical protein